MLLSESICAFECSLTDSFNMLSQTHMNPLFVSLSVGTSSTTAGSPVPAFGKMREPAKLDNFCHDSETHMLLYKKDSVDAAHEKSAARY